MHLNGSLSEGQRRRDVVGHNEAWVGVAARWGDVCGERRGDGSRGRRNYLTYIGWLVINLFYGSFVGQDL